LKTFEINKGSTRTVVIVLRRFVLKFPRIEKALGRTRLISFLWGVIANLTEFSTFLLSKNRSFLVPVWSIGLVSFQRYEEGETPTENEIRDILNRLPEGQKNILEFTGSHDLSARNWKKNAKGYRLFDYGDASCRSPIPISYFLFYSDLELSRLCAPTPPIEK